MNKLKEIREKQGFNQRELAEQLHVPQSLISAIENDRLKPWPKIVNGLVDLLHISAGEIFPDIKECK